MNTVNFYFDGTKYNGYRGEPLAAALLRAGIVHFTDSINFQRPRGIVGIGVEESNAMVQFVSGAQEPTVPATMIELVEGLSVSSLAGVGNLPDEPETARYDKVHRHTDVLVVGAGIAGLTAARKHLLKGREVILMDDQPCPGGHYSHLGTVLPASFSEILTHKSLMYLPRTTVTGLYDQGFAVAIERRSDHLSAEINPNFARIRTWHIRASHIVLAPGAFQRPLVFANNDRPGILLSHAAATYVDRYQVRSFHRAVVATVDNQGYRDAVRLHKSSVQVVMILDSRSHASGKSVSEALACGIPVKMNCTVVDTAADTRGVLCSITAVDLLTKVTTKMDADLLAVSGGWTPTVHLGTFIGIKPTWSEPHAAFLIQRDSGYLSTVGMLAGDFGNGDGQSDDSPAIFFGPDLDDTQARFAFVDHQRDATLHELRRAVGAGLSSIEHIKRFTTIGTAHDQGKTSGTTTVGLMSQLVGNTADKNSKAMPIPAIGTLSFRPPYIPIPFVALAGRERGLLIDPIRTSSIHEWHVKAGAPMEDVGQWKRPWYFPLPGEEMPAALLRECAAARKGVAIMDASTLGKIDIQGPDAAQFLDRIYTNVFSTLKVGSCRYGLMCGADGMVFDDGVTTRLGHNHFLMTTTTGGAARVLAWLEEWLQTEWPELKVFCASVTEQIATIALVGPKSRELMGLLAPALDVSKEGFAFMESRESSVAGIPARVARISFSGELAFEINVPAWFGLHVWEQAMKLGQPFHIAPYGTETMHILRAEKGFIIVGQETDGTQTPADLDMEWIVSKKKDFIGKRSFLRDDVRRAGRHQLVGLLPEESAEVIPEGAYLVTTTNGKAITGNPLKPMKHIGYVTSSYFSAELGRSFALALVADGLNRMGEQVAIPLGNKIIPATICKSVFVDKENTRRDG